MKTSIASSLFYLLICFWLSALYSPSSTLRAQSPSQQEDMKGCIVLEDGSIERLDLLALKNMLMADKDSALYAFRMQAFDQLTAHATYSKYSYQDAHCFVQIGNFFDEQRKHAVVIYMSDAFEISAYDFRVDLYLFEITPEKIKQVLYLPRLSSYYREVAAGISDFEGSGTNDLIIATSEPEWGSISKPANEYYHLFHYNPTTATLDKVVGFEQLANPVYFSPRHLYTFQTCGCGGDCWYSTLYEQQGSSIVPIAQLENSCAGIGQLFAIKNKSTKVLAAEAVVVADKWAIEGLWKRYLNDLEATK